MKKLLLLLATALAFTIPAESQIQTKNSINWDLYQITGSLSLGRIQKGFYADSSAWLQLGNDSTNKGFLLPRILHATSIPGPVKGLIAYCHDSAGIIYYNGSSWLKVGTGTGGGGGGGGGSTSWGSITGTLSAQTDLNTALGTKQTATNIHDSLIGFRTLSNSLYLQKSPADNTIQYVDVTNTGSFGQSTRQVHFGSNETIVDAGLNFQKGALLNVTAGVSTGGGKPIFESFSCPGSGSVNGVIWLNYPQVDGKVNLMMMARSNAWEGGSGSTDIVFTERLLTTEATGVTTKGKVINIQGVTSAANNHWFPSGGDKVTFTNPLTRLVEIQNNDSHRWSIGALGEVHNDGSPFSTPVTSASNITVSRASFVYIYTGGGGTITLDNPTTNAGQIFTLVNMGTGDVTFNYSIYLDASTTTTIMTFGHPNNKYKIQSDGTKYIVLP